ncbi:MAG: EAL domain-containing protein [Lachnospiraceae bacterium]|nr:EAL domain-containing protein [Lachnospiraceae bacterium]
MKRKKIGVLIGQIEENTQNLFMQGFLGEAFSKDYDVCIFSMYQKYQETPLREIGDSNIFRLVNYNILDAIIILLDTIQTPGVADALEQRIHDNFQGPVLAIDKESRFFKSLMIDHRTPMKKLVDHLIEVHGYRDIVFLNGIKEHIHSIQRLQGYKDSMEAHGLPVSEDKIFYGTYWYDSGDEMVDTLMRDPEHLPDAIACANDCMAIGVSAAFAKHGIHIPEDIAIIGYDSIEDGRTSPVPLTSADIPAKEVGVYAAQWIDASIHQREIPEFQTKAPLFIGGSCGCSYKAQTPTTLRKNWDTELSTSSFYSCFNHIMDDLLAQTDYQSYFNTVFQYTYQIRKFKSFHLCLNEGWNHSDFMISEDALRRGYTKNVYRVVKCGADEHTGNSIDFTDSFESSILLPELEEYREEPAAYIFTPVYFDDRCFGYAAISYGNEPRVYSEVYRVWLRSIMQGMEAFFRQNAMRSLISTVESNQIRDALTGLYNYRGFLKHAEELGRNAMHDGNSLLIICVDICNMQDINTTYGRQTGDQAIVNLAKMIARSLEGYELCCRMGNAEFLIASVAEGNAESRIQEMITALHLKCQSFNQTHADFYQLKVCFGSKSGIISDKDMLEDIISDAVSEKNGMKQTLMKQAEYNDLTEEDWENDTLVASILDNNYLKYYFQPIVSAKNGEIVSYEALMRADIEKRLSPPLILQSAERLNRLYDVERATFFNVINYIDTHAHYFENKKVFINSIPGCQLIGDDKLQLEQRMTPHAGRLVVEFTEETEMGDEQLTELKTNYERINIETAIDDYGAGYSNVNNLLRYMPRYVKIDRMLLADIQDNPQKQHFVRDIIEFAHDNDILALAEGVENSNELKEVIRLGADLIQGYYTAKPQPVPVSKIDDRIINEIIQYNQTTSSRYGRKRYTAAGDRNIPLVQLGLNKYTELYIPYSNAEDSILTLSGAGGFQSNLIIKIADGYCGSILLDNVSLGGEKGAACIELGQNCDVKIILENENEFRTGGIRVPESSTLTLQGDGNLSISTTSSKCFGIGNDINSRHGRLDFLQDGCLTIHTYGMHGIGIGSGLGGDIHIHRGRYELNINGQQGVCIGAISGDANISIEYCDMEMLFDLAYGAIIGSYEGSANVYMENVSGRFISGGNCVIGIGTINGKRCQVTVKNINLGFDMRSSECIGIGSKEADTDIHIQYASVKVTAEGKNAYALGNYTKTAHVHCENSDLTTQINSNFDTDIGATEENIYIANGRASFLLNGSPIEREVITAAL